MEEALVEMYLAGVSVRRVEDITEALWGTRVSPSTVSELNQKIYVQIEAWRNRPIDGEHAYVYMDGIWLKRSWGGEVKNVAVLVAIGVRSDGYREILGVVEGLKEDTESWRNFLRHLKERGMQGVRLLVSDKCLGLVEAAGEFYPEATWQRCMVHWYRNVMSVVPKGKVKEAMAMLKAIHAQEDRQAARDKASLVAEKLDAMRLSQAATIVRDGVDETLSYMAFPREHWTRIRTNNVLERIMREIRRRTRVVGNFPDGKSAVMLVAARLRHIAGTRWGKRVYLDMERIREGSRGPLALPDQENAKIKCAHLDGRYRFARGAELVHWCRSRCERDAAHFLLVKIVVQRTQLFVRPGFDLAMPDDLLAVRGPAQMLEHLFSGGAPVLIDRPVIAS